MTHYKIKLNQQVDYLNRIIRFLAKRDLADLTSDKLFSRRGVRQVDRLILMGGITTPDFAEIAAKAYHSGFAKKLMVVGGIGHSTQNLRDNIVAHPIYATVSTASRSEAEMLCDILIDFLGVEPNNILAERESTNCGNNATFALQVARNVKAVPEFAVILQDPIMQRRTYESFLHGWRTELTVFDCFAPIIPLLGAKDGKIEFAEPSHVLYYRMNSFLDLVMGEIPRLRDDENGYGPNGHGFIGHIDIPEEVLQAFENLIPHYSQFGNRNSNFFVH